ncbi:F-box protein At5g07610-like [Bidens hawaiensis]|uniref:F-box protein At5g07610-like n=1 Tax=Bidens hawaiensis TaxID=980011 RepID=UPI0040496452
MGLAFHQTPCLHYKVVCILNINPSEDLFLIQIYSFDTGEWKTISNFVDHDYTHFGSGAYWNGAIHWVPSCPNPSYFDLNLEQLQKLPFPMQVRVENLGGYFPIYFGESRGHLHLVAYVKHESRFYLNVYEMLGDHSGWFVKFKVDLHDLPEYYPNINEIHSIYRDREIIDFIEPEDARYGWLVTYRVEPHGNVIKCICNIQVIDVVRGEEDTFMVLKMQQKILRYNVLDKSVKQLFDGIMFKCLPRSGFREVHRYIQSLTSF